MQVTEKQSTPAAFAMAGPPPFTLPPDGRPVKSPSSFVGRRDGNPLAAQESAPSQAAAIKTIFGIFSAHHDLIMQNAAGHASVMLRSQTGQFYEFFPDTRGNFGLWSATPGAGDRYMITPGPTSQIFVLVSGQFIPLTRLPPAAQAHHLEVIASIRMPSQA